MGHWSESLVDEALQGIDGAVDRQQVADLLAEVGQRLDVLTGRTFHAPRIKTSVFEPNGLPLVDVPDLIVGSMGRVDGMWAIPDPVRPEIAAVLQLSPVPTPFPTAVAIADALWIAGQLVAQASRAGGLSREYVVEWLGMSMAREERLETMRRAMDPSVRISVPIIGHSIGGWWFQISRRLVWITNDTEDEGRIYEPVLHQSTNSAGEAVPLMATEPILIAAPMSRHPVDWAFTARIWPENVQVPADRAWSRISKAIHDAGTPTITVDSESTPHEIACQMVLKAYWHGRP